MREIKFRAWVKPEKRMYGPEDTAVAWYKWSNEEVGNNYLTIKTVRGGKFDDDVVVMQYTGLKDKNGKEIYESDILKVKMSGGDFENYKVEWDEISASYGSTNSDDSNYIISDFWIKCEVIGNIYENKELLDA